MDKIEAWLRSHQYVAVWSTLCAVMVILYEIVTR